MLSSKIKNIFSFNNRMYNAVFMTVLLSIFYSGSALADWPQIVMHNFMTMGTILQTISIMMGLSLMLGGMMKLKRYGEMRTFMSHQMMLSEPFMMIFAGSMLLILPTMIATGLFALWGTQSPLWYQAGVDASGPYLKVVIIFVRLIGVGAFLRGVVILSRSGKIGGQPGTSSKALIHMLGGLLAINIVGTADLLMTIFGLT